MTTARRLKTRLFTGIPVVVSPSRDVIKEIIGRVRDQSPEGCDVHLLEMNGVAIAHSSHPFRQVLLDACLVIPDGRWLEFFTRKDQQPLKQTRGEDLFRGVMDGDEGPPLRTFFLGATPGILQELQEVVDRDYQGVSLVGMDSPPFRDLTRGEIAELAQKIEDSRAQIVWIGISTPRQDFLAAELSRMTTCVVIAVGAAFEFVAGKKTAAPRWLRRVGFEWLFRLMSEPRRLWRRYLLGGIVFLVQVFRYRKSDTSGLPPSR